MGYPARQLTEQEDALLTRLYTKGVSLQLMSSCLECQVETIQRRAQELNLQRPAGYKRAWAEEDDRLLERLRQEGLKPAEIAKRMNRSKASIDLRLRTSLYVERTHPAPVIPRPAVSLSTPVRKKPTPKTIPCMNDQCKQLFRSQGPHNRLCPRCRGKSLDPIDVPVRIGL